MVKIIKNLTKYLVKCLLNRPMLLYYRHLNQGAFDVNAIQKVAKKTEHLTHQIERVAKACMGKNDNPGFFEGVRKYNNLHLALPIGNNFMLYAPNVAIIDFLLKNVNNPDAEILLDYACGIGYLFPYLKALGFKNLYGYDNFQQIREKTVRCFLKSFDLEGLLITDRSRLKEISPSIITIVGIYYDWLDLDLVEFLLQKETSRYVLFDTKNSKGFSHFNYDDWRLFYRYPGLLDVYIKK